MKNCLRATLTGFDNRFGPKIAEYKIEILKDESFNSDSFLYKTQDRIP